MNDLLRDSCSALLSEAMRYPSFGAMYTKDAVHRAAWLACGTKWLEVLEPHYVEGQKPAPPTPEHEGVIAAFGIHPRDWLAGGSPCPRYDEIRSDGNFAWRGGHFLSHPLYLGMMFSKLLNSPTDGQWFFDRHAELPQKLDSGAMYSYFWKPTWIPPFTPADLGISTILQPTHHDNISMMAWFDRKKVVEMLKNASGVGVEDVAKVASVLGTKLDVVDPADAALLRWWNSTSRLPYESMAQMLRLTSQLRAETRLEVAKGVRAGFGIVRVDTTREFMIRGLRAVAGMTEDGIETFSALYGRSPTISELRAVGGAGMINILYYMPWDFLEPLLDDDASTLRAMTLPHLKALDGLKRHCLQNHEKRAKLLHYAGLEPGPPVRVTDKTNSSDWKKIYGGLATQYRQSRAARVGLEQLEPDPTIRLVSVLPRFGACSPGASDRILRHHPAFDKIKNLTSTITEPTWNPDHLVIT